MTKMIKAKIRLSDGEVTNMRTYADDSKTPEQVFANAVSNGGEILEYEWIDTLTEHRQKWNEENPNLQIPLDL